jgi:nitroimidazol reductase NimA-like FMN-containing flavoprotein (pyridoxamine 5'-phosphate oxidase superfamily)
MNKPLKRVPPSTEPSFQTLDEPGVRELLTRNHVGRLAFARHAYVDIEPIHYVFADDIVHFRTAPGSKLVTLARNQWVAFEVDEIEGKFDWRSVVLHGVIYIVEDGDLPEQHADYEATLSHLRTFIPETFRRDDPTPFRSVLVRLFVQTASGRSATTQGPPSTARRTAGSANMSAGRHVRASGSKDTGRR